MSDSIQRMIAKEGPFHVFKTLLGGEPDINRRRIYDLRKANFCGEPVETFNAEMREWTPELEATVQARLKELNAPFTVDPKGGTQSTP